MVEDRQEQRRFIPTCVGNTDATKELLILPFGSSPRAWGTLRHEHSKRVAPRFIPTCVGNTALVWCPSRSRAVHPHVRGEHVAAIGV